MSSFEALVSQHPRRDDLVREGDAEGSRAAVAAILRANAGGDGEILFIRRAERANDPWSGHMALPGGRRDATDATLLATAIRETREEVGLDLKSHGRVLARLPDISPYSKMPHPLTVSPFVFAITHAELATNEEVAEAIWAPLSPLLRGEHVTTFRWRRDGVDLELPAFDVNGHVVWGLTYRILELLREQVG